MTDNSLPITAAFLKTVRSYPNNTVFHYYRDGWERILYRDFADMVLSLSSYLIAMGLKKSMRVAILSENGPDWCKAYLAVLMAGGVAVPVDPQLGPDEIKNILADSEAGILFHNEKAKPNVLTALERLSRSERHPPLPVNFDSADFQNALSSVPLTVFPKTVPEDVASVIYTSGTTGKPKGVVLTHSNFSSDALAVIDARLVSHEDNVLSVLPLHHTYAFMCTFLVPLFVGASITYPASLKGPDLVSAVKQTGVTVIIGVPQLLIMIRNGIMNKINGAPAPLRAVLTRFLAVSGLVREKLNINIGKLIFRSVHSAFGEKFRFFASGGAKLDPEVMKELEALGFMVLEGYGLTETSPVITFNPVTRRKPGSAGKPLPTVEIKIVAPAGEEGEIAVKGPMVMKGYYNDPHATAEVLSDGWLRTGDLGKVDKDGYLFITGRSKEVIVLSSGKNIYPEEVEQLYLASPLIKEICVFGLNKNATKEKLYAVIVPDFEYARDSRVTDIRQRLKQDIAEISARMPSYMRITGYSIRKEPLAKTALGKIRRFLVKEEMERNGTNAEPEGEYAIFTEESAGAIVRILERFTKEKKRIRPDDNLELDIGLDSLSKIELTAALEKEFSMKLPEDFIQQVQTVAELIRKMKDRAGTGPALHAETSWREILSAGPSEEDLRMISLKVPDHKMIPAHIAYSVLKILFRLLFRINVRGLENLPGKTNFIIAANHTSYLDGPIVILTLPFSNFKTLYSLGLRDFFKGFLKGGIGKLAHVIPIDSSSYLNKALQIAAYVLTQGRSLLVFPEGERSFDGELKEFKKGVGVLALEIGVPVIPVYIHGAFEALPRGSSFPKFKKITVEMGNALHAADVDFSGKPESTDDYEYFSNILKERIEGLKETVKEY